MTATALSTPEIELVDISRHFGGVIALDAVSFAVQSGSVTGLIGPNGAGKTTLLNLLTGFFTPTSGHIRLRGVDVTGRRPHQMAKLGLGRTYQNLLLLDEETVTENVRIGRHLIEARSGLNLRRAKAAKAASVDVVDRLVEELGLTDVAGTVVKGLPYGLRRRVEIARALATEASVIVLDEPTAGMTRDESDDIAAVIDHLRQRGSTVLLVEHNVRLVTQMCDEVLVLDWGRLIGRDTADKVWDLDAVRTAYLGMSAEVVTNDVAGH